MNQLHLFPNAKINLGLLIKGKRADGYHELQTVFIPAPLQDELIILENNSLQTPGISIEGIDLPGIPEENLCYKAWKLIKNIEPTLPAVQFHLIKNIPAGAGLGGGSADAAFTLKGLVQLFELKISKTTLHQLAIQLGADVPFFLENKPMLASGIGEILEPIEISIPGEIKIITPPIFSDTKQAYRELNYDKTHPTLDLKSVLQQDISEWRNILPNDFEPSVFKRYPELAIIKSELYDQGALYASLSGSGSAVYGIFPN